MTAALVPLGADAQAVVAVCRRPRVQMRYFGQAFSRAARGMKQAFDAITTLIVDAWKVLHDTMVRARLIPPPARDRKHGTIWVSLEGERLRVRGRRGRPRTFHWGSP